MGTVIIITSGVLLFTSLLGMFISERGESHFDHMLRLYHERKLAKMKHELELEKIKLQLLAAPMPGSENQ